MVPLWLQAGFWGLVAGTTLLVSNTVPAGAARSAVAGRDGVEQVC